MNPTRDVLGEEKGACGRNSEDSHEIFAMGGIKLGKIRKNPRIIVFLLEIL